MIHDTYKELPSNPTVPFKRELAKLILKGFNEQILNKKERAYLVPRIPVMYHFLKIHKDSSNPPKRPIIALVDI